MVTAIKLTSIQIRLLSLSRRRRQLRQAHQAQAQAVVATALKRVERLTSILLRHKALPLSKPCQHLSWECFFIPSLMDLHLPARIGKYGGLKITKYLHIRPT